MQLTYRGAHYDYTPCAAKAARETNVFRALRPTYNLHYRGSVYTVDPNAEQSPAAAKFTGQLFYRGVTYSLNGELLPGARKATPGVSSRPAFNTKASGSAEFAAVHRDNLHKNVQHRLQVARDKQDQVLINLLERELQQIV